MSAISVGGDLVHYEVLGRGRAVILLHGWIGCWRYWIPTMQVLQAKYRVYALDLFGYGDSGKNPGKYTLEHQIALLDDFMRELGLPKAALIGHGLGALVAAEYTRRYEDRVPRLMLASAPLFDPGDLEHRRPHARKAAVPAAARSATQDMRAANPSEPTVMSPSVAMRTALKEAMRARESITTAPAQTAERPFVDDYPVYNPLIGLMTQLSPEAILARCFKRGEPNYEKIAVDIARMDSRAPRIAAETFDAGALLDTLRTLSTPMVVLHGADDLLFPAPTEEIWNYITLDKDHSLLPIPLPNVRHFPMIEDERFMRLANDFLEVPDISKLEIKERWRRQVR